MYIIETGIEESKGVVKSVILLPITTAKYEIGTANGKCTMSSSISELLTNEFGIDKMATGWPEQIQEYAKRNNENWILSFRELVLKHFYRTQDFKIDSEFKKHLKSRIKSKIGQLNLDWVASHFEDWRNEWLGLVDLKELNFKTIWNLKELEIIRALDNEIKRCYNDEILVTDNLLELRNEFERITKTQQ